MLYSKTNMLCRNRQQIDYYMKNLILLVLALYVSVKTYAQSEWESPSIRQTEICRPDKPQSKVKVRTATDDKYIKEGAVPEEDGKIVFRKSYKHPLMSKTDIYNDIYNSLETLTKTSNQIRSSIILINKKDNTIVAHFSEWMEFSRSFFALDRTKFNFTLIASCSDGQLDLCIKRISYNYEEGRPTGFRATAEELISDKRAINKKRTKLVKRSAKFRKNTIDRINTIFKRLNSSLNE